METFVIDTIKRFLIKVELPSIFCIYKQNENVYNNGIHIENTDISKLQDIENNHSKNLLYLHGLHINDNKFVVVLIEEINGIYYIHSKSNEEGLVVIIGQDYSLFVYYENEFLPMLHSVKLEKLKKNINFIDRLLI